MSKADVAESHADRCVVAHIEEGIEEALAAAAVIAGVPHAGGRPGDVHARAGAELSVSAPRAGEAASVTSPFTPPQGNMSRVSFHFICGA